MQAVVAGAGAEIWPVEDALVLAAAEAALVGVYVGLRCLGRQRVAAAVSLAWARANSAWCGCAEATATLTRRTERRTWAPILRSARRSVPQDAAVRCGAGIYAGLRSEELVRSADRAVGPGGGGAGAASPFGPPIITPPRRRVSGHRGCQLS